LKLGLYGGTFDPIHNGHLHVITQLLERGVVDQILVIPAGEPRLRTQAPKASGGDRRAMCQLAINDLPQELRSKVLVNPIEILRMGPSYTIDTVEAIAQAYPEDEIVMIVGTDAYEKLDQWHRVDELMKLVTLEVIQRPGTIGDLARDIDAIDVSATQVRLGQTDQVSPSVANYIKEHNLYVS
jgi:nicotinate-nucleotide adenylyltransferase